MVDQFTKEQFEQALPKNHWYYLGFVDNEHVYRIPIIKDQIEIEIRSSVKANSMSADSGQDSIRCWLTNGSGKPLGSKISKWITRLPNWDVRMLDTLRVLWGWAQWASFCPDCQIPKGIFKVKKSGKNKGRVFCKCTLCNNHFQWKE